ncbi:pentapeptide repeat-containing protein [Microcoleus sp. FACHB-1515]|uniref:pentapeptide repeat-containing protein n=1 Tax=Cyanophyceae TaxID=3028117 RepID=UPI0016889DDA|nr:pentapeptide repeat-containing protein [Microcoleus sp. FACHB-1515]MBD2092502.1 pentapeptide repeat-containing protein [Microcoleus sp. FACHB-1515]
MTATKRSIRGKRFREVKQNFENVQAGHKFHQKFLLFLFGIFGICISSLLPFTAAEGLIGLIIKPTFNNEFDVFISFFEISAFVVTLILTVLYGLEFKFIVFLIILTVVCSSFTALLPGLISVWVDIIEFLLSIIFTWSGCVVIATVITFVSLISNQLGQSAAIATATCSIVVMFMYSDLPSIFSKATATVIALTIVLASIVICKKAINYAPKFKWITSKAFFWSSIGATSFYGLDLSGIRFDNSDLSYTDLRKTNLTRSSFSGVVGLELARTEGTILEDPKIRKLLTTKDSGYAEDFTDANLRGADLRGADLREAILVRAQLLDADLSGANLTDACIQDWNINHNTRFTKVECKRVYLKRSPSGHFLEPKPDSGEFLPGEFEKWVTDIRDTIDLIFQNGLNWRAFAFSLTQTAIDHEGLDLAVRSIENKGDGVVVAKVGVSLETNKTAIHQQMTGHYQEAMLAIESGYELVLRAKDEEINRLTQFRDQQQKFIQGLVTGIAETKGQVLIQGEGNRIYLMDQAGDIMENSNQNVSAGGNVDMSSGGRVSIGGGMTGSSVTLGDLSGQVSNTIQQLHDIKTTEAQELVQILAKLQTAIESDRVLTPDQKQQALEAVSTLAEEGSKPPEKRATKFCTMAVNALKGLASSLTNASQLAEAMKTLLPALTGIFAL